VLYCGAASGSVLWSNSAGWASSVGIDTWFVVIVGTWVYCARVV